MGSSQERNLATTQTWNPQATEWGMPVFVFPKPDGTCRVIADVRELNKVTRQEHHPLPTIQGTFHRRRNFTCVTPLDMSMQFHTFQLDDESSWLCAIATPFGKFCCLRPPMGCPNSRAWAQAAMEEPFHDPSDVECHIDDVAIFLTNFDEHLKTLGIVLNLLKHNDFTVKAQKCHWCKSSAPWLGHTISGDGIWPNPEKIAPILLNDTTFNQRCKVCAQARNFESQDSHLLSLIC